MENFCITAVQVATLFVLMGVGALVRRLGVVDEGGSRGLVNVLVYVVNPLLIVDVFQRPFDPGMFSSFSLAVGIGCAGHLLVMALAYLFVRNNSEDTEKALRMAAVFSNAGFMGLPLEKAILGDLGVFFGVTYVVCFNLFFWTWGIKIFSRTGGMSIKKIFINPGMTGIVIGLPLFLLSWRLPAMIGQPVHLIAEMNTPIAMFAVGFFLFGAKLGRVARIPAVYVTTAIRLLVYPLLLLGGLWLFRGVLDRTMSLAVLIGASAPTGALVGVFAAAFNRDVDTAVAMVSGTTLVSVVTIPLVVAIGMHVL